MSQFSAPTGFSAKDEQLVTALVATAAVAAENARLYETARTREEWLQASATITRKLLTADRATRPAMWRGRCG